MKNKTTEPFVILPRKLRDQLANGAINFHEFSVLSLIYIITNPINGIAIVSYQQLSIETKIKEPYIRKIIKNLVSHKLIWFKPHRGRGGTFPLWVDGFVKSKGINDIEKIKKNELNANYQTGYSPTNSQVDTQPDNNFHNSKDVKTKDSKEPNSISNNTVFTTTHNNNENNKDNILTEKNKKGLALLEKTKEELEKKRRIKELNNKKEELANKFTIK